MPRTARETARLPSLSSIRLALNVHLEIKLVPVVEGLLDAGADVHVTTCNPDTVDDAVAQHLRRVGASVVVAAGMDDAAWTDSLDDALAWRPTHVSEMGAALCLRAHRRDPLTIRAAQEITGSGIASLQRLSLRVPVVDLDSEPAKTELHNRHGVGASAWHTFTERTHLMLHGMRVLVVGYGPVGHGVALAARDRGALVTVAEVDPERALFASFDGFETLHLEDAAPRAEVVVTATGRRGVITRSTPLRDGAILLNVGHLTGEIDLGDDREPVLPGLDAVKLDSGAVVFLVGGGAMANLAAGWGDGLNNFDITNALIVAGIAYLLEAEALRPGIHPFDPAVAANVLAPIG